MKRSSFKQIYIGILAGSIVILFLSMMAVYIHSQRELQESEVFKMETIGKQIDDSITASLGSLRGLRHIHYVDIKARDILLKDNEKETESSRFENQKYVDTILEHIITGNESIQRATIVNEYGNVYSTDSSVPQAYVDAVEERMGEWSLSVGRDREFYYGGLQNGQTAILTYLQPLYGYNNNKEMALLAVDLNYTNLKSVLSNLFSDEKNGTSLIYYNNKVLFRIGKRKLDQGQKWHLMKKSDGILSDNQQTEMITLDEENMILTVRQNIQTGWKIAMFTSEQDMFQDIEQKMLRNIFLLAVISFLAFVVSSYYTRSIAAPLEHFCAAIRNMGNGKLNRIEMQDRRMTREVMNVVDNYNEMADRMNEYLSRELVYERNQRIIQSKMLKYQINPHFLYNTLNTIASMGELSDFPEIVTIAKNLSYIMQYNLRGSSFVSLASEIEMVKSYIEIQQIRFPDTFAVQYDIAEDVKELQIIKFILQPIVENIFQHGFSKKNQDNQILIRAYREEKRLFLVVRDNGRGIEKEKIREINAKLAEERKYTDEEDTGEHQSIGIYNVNRRIRIYYGKEYGVRIAENTAQGAEMILTLGAAVEGEEQNGAGISS
ncbi:MAG: histidine kinase [Ruminococcus sp.]|nr:histidine kinase [Fusicatenibacter saccharivorans]MDD6374812.1 histidine kinase [Ruminococcus sp.]MDD6575989.1 histidine kinase [Fusicatenibacter saccharivorans]MDY5074387.1 histidine kinase [Fusicatenibacter saccharivorans]